jgi:very-short-patch-repair endonuclease
MDDAALLELAAAQHGLASDTQAFELGYSTRTVRRRVRAGEWSRPLPGVLRCTGAPPTDHQAAMAAVLWAGPDAVVSHTTAAWLWSLDGVRPSGKVEVTAPPGFDRRSDRVRVHTSALSDRDRATVGSIPATSIVRTLIDLAAVLTSGPLELAIEDAFRRGLASPPAFEARAAELLGRGRPGTRRLRTLIESRGSRPPTGSAAEVRLERLLVSGGLPAPVRQHAITHGGRTIYVDFAYPERRLAIEFDSVRWHTGRAKLENDAERRNLLRAAGWDLVTVTHGMLRERARTLTLVRDAWLQLDIPAKGWPENPNGR